MPRLALMRAGYLHIYILGKYSSETSYFKKKSKVDLPEKVKMCKMISGRLAQLVPQPSQS